MRITSTLPGQAAQFSQPSKLAAYHHSLNGLTELSNELCSAMGYDIVVIQVFWKLNGNTLSLLLSIALGIQ